MSSQGRSCLHTVSVMSPGEETNTLPEPTKSCRLMRESSCNGARLLDMVCLQEPFKPGPHQLEKRFSLEEYNTEGHLLWEKYSPLTMLFTFPLQGQNLHTIMDMKFSVTDHGNWKENFVSRYFLAIKNHAKFLIRYTGLWNTCLFVHVSQEKLYCNAKHSLSRELKVYCKKLSSEINGILDAIQSSHVEKFVTHVLWLEWRVIAHLLRTRERTERKRRCSLWPDSLTEAVGHTSTSLSVYLLRCRAWAPSVATNAFRIHSRECNPCSLKSLNNRRSIRTRAVMNEKTFQSTKNLTSKNCKSSERRMPFLAEEK